MTTGEPGPPVEPAVREELERILASTHFAAAEGARRLLRFLVEEKLAGRGLRLKEYTLAVEVFGRDESFDSKTNPAVRVEASRLRRRLEHYYLTLGREDPVLIELPRGTYVPNFLPHADVLHLREDLAAARAGRAGASGAESIAIPFPGGPSIAVMPFENLGEDRGARFADGITVEIITALSRFRELRVLGRSTVLNHRGERDAVRLHAQLGASYVLTGTVRLAERRLRVHAELLSGEDGRVLWVEGFERDLGADAIFEVQDEIARQVVAKIAQPHGVIARPAAAAARRKAPESLDAYECLLLFYDYVASHSAECHLKARTALEAETRKEPGFAALWAALSMVHVDTWRFGFNVREARVKARDEALGAARKAIQLDPLNSLGYHALFLANFARGDLKGFREAGDRALELNPNNSDILADYGLHLTMCEDWVQGRLFLKMALTVNPEPPDWYWFPFFIWHFENGEHDEALDFALRARSPQFFWTHGMHAMAYTTLGMRDEAAAAVARLLEVYPDFPAKAHEELALWVSPERRERPIAVLRQAGLPIPPSERESHRVGAGGESRSQGPPRQAP